MRYFTSSEIFISVIAALIFGAFFGSLYSSINTIVFWMRKIIEGVIVSLGLKEENKAEKSGQKSAISNIKSEAYNFFFVVFMGTFFLILCYYALDFVFRFYMITLVLAAFFFIKSTIGELINRFLNFILKNVFRIYFLIMYTILYPIRKLLTVSKRCALHIKVFISHRIKLYKSKKIAYKKIKSIKSILKVKY